MEQRTQYQGHVWGERFFSRIIRDEQDFARTSGYSDENPVKANLAKEAQGWIFGGLFHKLRKIIGLVDKVADSELFFPANTPLADLSG
jgi:hypothetical protein